MSNSSKEFDKYEHLRENLQKETNRNNITPFNPEIYKKSAIEREELKNAISKYKATLK